LLFGKTCFMKVQVTWKKSLQIIKEANIVAAWDKRPTFMVYL